MNHFYPLTPRLKSFEKRYEIFDTYEQLEVRSGSLGKKQAWAAKGWVGKL